MGEPSRSTDLAHARHELTEAGNWQGVGGNFQPHTRTRAYGCRRRPIVFSGAVMAAAPHLRESDNGNPTRRNTKNGRVGGNRPQPDLVAIRLVGDRCLSTGGGMTLGLSSGVDAVRCRCPAIGTKTPLIDQSWISDLSRLNFEPTEPDWLVYTTRGARKGEGA